MSDWIEDDVVEYEASLLDAAPRPRLLGPSSPFWQCPSCKALDTSPLMFRHAKDCGLRNSDDRVQDSNIGAGA